MTKPILYLGFFQGQGFYLTDAKGPSDSMYFQDGCDDLADSKPTYFKLASDTPEGKQDAKQKALEAGARLGFEVREKREAGQFDGGVGYA